MSQHESRGPVSRKGGDRKEARWEGGHSQKEAERHWSAIEFKWFKAFSTYFFLAIAQRNSLLYLLNSTEVLSLSICNSVGLFTQKFFRVTEIG